MTEFNRLTIVAACSVLAEFMGHDALTTLFLELDHDDNGSGSCNSRMNRIAREILEWDNEVVTLEGKVLLSRAVVERAIHAPPVRRDGEIWRKFVAGLRMDGFEIDKIDVESEPVARPAWPPRPVVARTKFVLRRMYPSDVPSLHFKEAESEILALLKKHRFDTSAGHIAQAIDSFSRGKWASANGDLRTFFQSYMEEIAGRLGCNKPGDAAAIRKYLGEIEPPFVFSDYNEWFANEQKQQFLSGLWSRMHPHGSHPGLSEQDDCTFRLHITLITARLFLRRFDQREAGK